MKEELSKCCGAEIWQCKTGAFGAGNNYPACSKCHKSLISNASTTPPQEHNQASVEETLTEILAKLHTMPIEEHRCRFNDGNQSCNCYKEGLRDCRRIIKEYILKDNERTHL